MDQIRQVCGATTGSSRRDTRERGSSGRSHTYGGFGDAAVPCASRSGYPWGWLAKTSPTFEKTVLIEGAIAGGKNADTVTATNAAAKAYSTRS